MDAYDHSKSSIFIWLVKITIEHCNEVQIQPGEGILEKLELKHPVPCSLPESKTPRLQLFPCKCISNPLHVTSMNPNLEFYFRSKARKCTSFIDSSEFPWLVFVVLADGELIQEFGDEITLKTDGKKLLPKSDDYAELVLLRQSIFNALLRWPKFNDAKENIK